MSEVATTAATSEVANVFDSSKSALETSFTQAYVQIADLMPKVVVAIVVVVVGYIIARLAARFITALSDKIGLQVAAERSGLWQSMSHMGIKRNVTAIVGTIVFWLLLCVFLMAAFNILHLAALYNAMSYVVNYIPKLLVATVVVVVGLLAASFLRGVVATSADRVGISYAPHLANGAYYVLAGLTFYAAFNALDIQFALLEKLVMIAFGGLALGFGLSFGLGGRDVMAGILAGYYVRQRMQAGDHVSVAGMEGTVREVGPVATIIETEENGLLNRHSIPNTKMLLEGVR
jgi:hypothetical protein